MKTREHHLDLESDDTCIVNIRQYAGIQVEMIKDHKTLLEEKYGRGVSDIEATLSWITRGYAQSFSEHYILEKHR